MKKRIDFGVKEKMVSLTGACFWFYKSFHSFLDSCGVSKTLYNRFPKESYNKYDVMRNLLEHFEETGQVDIINNIISNFYRLHNAVDREQLDEEKAKLLLKEFKQLVGNDPIEKEIERKKQQESIRQYKSSITSTISKAKQLEELNAAFIKLATTTNLTPQQRGFKLEDLLCDLLQYSEIEYSRPYKTNDGEQIDGHFRFEKFDYLIETKWISGQLKQKDLSIFDGKIRGKAQSTRGLILAAEGFDENAIQKFSGDSPRIILMSGEDLSLILNGRVHFFDAMKAKIDAIVRHGNINYPIRNIAT